MFAVGLAGLLLAFAIVNVVVVGPYIGMDLTVGTALLATVLGGAVLVASSAVFLLGTIALITERSKR
jgi:hypothetical protein